MAEIYRAQTSPGGSTALSGASPEVFGAAVGRGIEEAGATLGRIEERRKARDRDSQNAAAGLEYATISGELDKAEIDGRDHAAPGAAGHSEAIDKFADGRIATALGNIKDPRIREAYRTHYEQLRGNAAGRAYAFERATHTEKMVTDVGETTRTLALGQANNPDGQGLELSLDAVNSVWDNLDVADAIKVKGKRAAQREITLSYGNSMADKDPASFLGDGKNGGILGVISPNLEPEDVDRLRSRGQAELARLEAINNRKAALWESTRRDEIQAIIKRVGTLADYSVTDADFDAAAADATKMGDKTLVLDIANSRDLRDVATATRDFAPADWTKAVGELEKKGDKRTTGESMRLEHLRQLRPAAERRFNDDPQGWAGNAGVAPPPEINWDEPSPAQGAARAQWNRGFMKATGSASALLNPAEIKAFKLRADSGIAGQLETAQAMRDTFGVADAKLALQQIDKSNANLAIMVNLPANTAKDYRLGVEAIGRNPKLNNKEIANTYFSELGAAIPQQLRGPVFTAARAIAAAELDRAGNPDPDEDDYRQAFRRGVQRAAGATGANGGFVRWLDTPIWLPPEMPKDEALKRLSRAGPLELLAASTTIDGSGAARAPHYIDGAGNLVKYNADSVNRMLKRGKLESIAPGVFRVILEDGGHVMATKTEFWQFDIRKLK